MKGFFVGFLILVVYLVVIYIINGIALQRMAEKLNIDNSFLAWIPIGNAYLLGKIAGDELDFFGFNVPSLSIVLPVLSVAVGITSNIPYLGLLVAIITFIVNVMTFNKIAKIFKPEQASMYTVLSVIFPFVSPFLFLSLSNAKIKN